ncbi:hypothetical protein I7I50_02569 [Histoplasma capsulatum G186AR]|uniref:Uncharacterized protein n=1 Tax=Ajellomyces capsulatus TaxID=5037 RepID=A0A8H7Z8E2_AJECA|nr:hypothetical protein I7I52_00768 [Histoplasma capsulatum]QSS71646.1 hypothetical protein I7I50_02569 [Histoplasma capsulatum G186AR]
MHRLESPPADLPSCMHVRPSRQDEAGSSARKQKGKDKGDERYYICYPTFALPGCRTLPQLFLSPDKRWNEYIHLYLCRFLTHLLICIL